MRALITVFLFLGGFNIAFANAVYNSDTNVVEIRHLGSGGIATVFIHSERYITLSAVAFDQSTGRMINLCGIEHSLGSLVFLNNRLAPLVNLPNVSGVEPFTATDPETQEGVAAGWVHSYIFEGEDALDLLDLLMSNDSVGFAISAGEPCSETDLAAHGTITVNFETRGLERAMRRLK